MIMHLSDVVKHVVRRQREQGLQVMLGSPALPATIDARQRHLGVSFPEQLKQFYLAYDGLSVEDPHIEIVPLERLRFIATDRLHIVTIDRQHTLVLDTSHYNQAGEWDVLNSSTDERVTLTMASLWSSHLWSWIDRRRPIWESHMGLDYESFTTSTIACVHFTPATDVAEIERWLIDAGGMEPSGRRIVICDIDGTLISSRRGLLEAMSNAFGCPYTLANWDGAIEFLGAMETANDGASCDVEGSGYIVIIRHARSLWLRQVQDAGELVEAWLVIAGRLIRQSISLHLVFEM